MPNEDGNQDLVATLMARVEQMLQVTTQQNNIIGQLAQERDNLRIQLNQQQANPTGHPEVSRVTAKLPPFWRDNPELWFLQVEAQFDTAGITQEKTRYAHVIAQLDERYAKEVADIIRNPPQDQPYTKLKTELVQRLTVSEQRRVRQLLMEEELGDDSPSKFLRRLRGLSSTIGDDLLRTVWTQRLPAHVQAILQAQADDTLDKLATVADKVMEVYPGSPTAAAAPNPAVHAASTSSMDALQKRLDELSRQVAALQSQLDAVGPPRRSRSRSRAPATRRETSTSKDPTEDSGRCWYHRKYGAEAQKCTKPCTFSSNSTGNRK